MSDPKKSSNIVQLRMEYQKTYKETFPVYTRNTIGGGRTLSNPDNLTTRMEKELNQTLSKEKRSSLLCWG